MHSKTHIDFSLVFPMHYELLSSGHWIRGGEILIYSAVKISGESRIDFVSPARGFFPSEDPNPQDFVFLKN